MTADTLCDYGKESQSGDRDTNQAQDGLPRVRPAGTDAAPGVPRAGEADDAAAEGRVARRPVPGHHRDDDQGQAQAVQEVAGDEDDDGQSGRHHRDRQQRQNGTVMSIYFSFNVWKVSFTLNVSLNINR